ncbi:MAG: FtsW/RodA/SpoVE family cell cycle protein [Planctomycetes bacterium]|nr:FtsW/RodA/SpoVE family cell cycle protein [Planctomycetota bacterium]
MFRFLQGRLVLVRMIMLVCVLALISIGIASIYASGNPAGDTGGSFAASSHYWKKQAVFAGAGLAAFIAINAVNYRRFGPVSYWLYAGMLAVLAYILVDKYLFNVPFVPVINNSRRWIQIGPLPQFQPSEFFKLVYILTLAWYLRYRSNYRKISSLIGPFALTLLPMVLILREPDLGTVMLMMPMFLAMLFIAGAKVKHLVLIILLAVMVSPLLWYKMEDYQRMRISAVLLQSGLDGRKSPLMIEAQKNPRLASILGLNRERLRNWQAGEGYHLMRSKLVVASGGLSGQGFRRGPFVKYKFLPERHNDFIFALIGHQWGFIGCVMVLGLYAIIIMCALEIAANNTDPFGKFIAVGVIVIIAIQVLVNVAMTIGLMPITGLTLPLVSYGGSSLVVNMMMIGLLNNVGRTRPFSLAKPS